MKNCDKCKVHFINPKTRNMLIETSIYTILFYLLSNNDIRNMIKLNISKNYTDLFAALIFAIAYNIVKILTKKP